MTPLDRADRDDKILELMPLVRALARRYANRGEPLDDLIQVGTVGLIKAVDRFDPTRGTDLASFATPTILGEIRRHFRDRTWMLHVPRGAQDAHRLVNVTIEQLTGELGHSPSIREIATASGLSEDEILDAMAVGAAYQPHSLSQPLHPDDDPIEVGVDDEGFGLAEGRAALGGHFSALPEREQRILVYRFERGMTQSEIAAEIGISQMHVSRLISKAITTLRQRVGEIPEPS
jgi:RNA polymerase sigma-B factor